MLATKIVDTSGLTTSYTTDPTFEWSFMARALMVSNMETTGAFAFSLDGKTDNEIVCVAGTPSAGVVLNFNQVKAIWVRDVSGGGDAQIVAEG